MVVVTARIVAKPESRAALAEAIAGLTAVSRQDKGCTSYIWYVDLEDPNAFSTIETWETQDDIDAHMSADHTQAALAAAADMVSEAPVIMQYQVEKATQV
ncbi:MAG: putative quinol monooxygenase [Propionibacteriaceae bacterium]